MIEPSAFAFIRQLDPWTPIYNDLVSERMAEALGSYPQRYVLGVEARHLQDGINRSIAQLAEITATPKHYVPMRGTR